MDLAVAQPLDRLPTRPDVSLLPYSDRVNPFKSITMSGAAGKAASKVAQTASRAAGKANEIGGKPIDNPLSKATKKDPELYVRPTLPHPSDPRLTRERFSVVSWQVPSAWRAITSVRRSDCKSLELH